MINCQHNTVERGAYWRLLFGLLANLVLSGYLHADDTTCPKFSPAASSMVAHVIDGDTVILENGERVRLLGINTPELARENRQAEPMADRAHEVLSELLAKSSNEVVVQTGATTRDRHGRLLAYLFDRNGTNLGAKLVQQGLAFTVAIPPDLLHLPCYFDLERQAESSHFGIWNTWQIQDMDLHAAVKTVRIGFRILVGTVTRGENPQEFYLGNIRLIIPKASRKYFGRNGLDVFAGQRVRSRGWVISRRDGSILLLHHPSMLETKKGT